MKCYVALGSNLGNKLQNLSEALRLLAQFKDIAIEEISPVYRTEPIGVEQQPDYMNGMVAISTKLSSVQLMRKLLWIERKLGRIRNGRWSPRTIDLDLIAYGQKICKSKRLKLPHPRYHERKFVLKPLCDIAPDFIHPIIKSTNCELLKKLTPKSQRVTMVALWNGTQFSPSKKKRN